MNHWIHALLQELENDLLYADFQQAYRLCRAAVNRLAGYMKEYAFGSVKDEQLYFRVFKPRFMVLMLRAELLASDEVPKENVRSDVEPGFRAYYKNGDAYADRYYFREPACSKTDFTISMQRRIGSAHDSADKMVAKLLAEEWMEHISRAAVVRV